MGDQVVHPLADESGVLLMPAAAADDADDGIEGRQVEAIDDVEAFRACADDLLPAEQLGLEAVCALRGVGHVEEELRVGPVALLALQPHREQLVERLVGEVHDPNPRGELALWSDEAVLRPLPGEDAEAEPLAGGDGELAVAEADLGVERRVGDEGAGPRGLHTALPVADLERQLVAGRLVRGCLGRDGEAGCGRTALLDRGLAPRRLLAVVDAAVGHGGLRCRPELHGDVGSDGLAGHHVAGWGSEPRNRGAGLLVEEPAEGLAHQVVVEVAREEVALERVGHVRMCVEDGDAALVESADHKDGDRGDIFAAAIEVHRFVAAGLPDDDVVHDDALAELERLRVAADPEGESESLGILLGGEASLVAFPVGLGLELPDGCLDVLPVLRLCLSGLPSYALDLDAGHVALEPEREVVAGAQPGAVGSGSRVAAGVALDRSHGDP